MSSVGKRFIHYIKRLYEIMCKEELRVLPGHVAYFLFLSIIPLISLIGIIAAQLPVSLEDTVSGLNGIVPKQVIDIILPVFETPSFGAGMSIIIGFFLASNATSSLIVASNTLYKINKDNYISRRIKAIFMLIVFIILLLFVLVVMTYGSTLIEFIYNLLFEDHVPKPLIYLFYLLKWTIGVLVMFIMLKIIFTMAPNSNIPSKTMNRGAIFTTFAWLIATYLFSIYVTNFSNYNLFYSSLASIIVFLIWIYILSISLVVGIAINSEYYFKIQGKKKKA